MADPLTAYQVASIGMAAFGAITGFLGGRKQDAINEEIAQAQFQMNTAQHTFNWQEARDAYWYTIEGMDLAEYNLETTRKWKHQTAINEWIDKDKQRLFDYSNQVDAYEASLEAMNRQLGYNTTAANLAVNASKRAYQDELQLMSYQIEDMAIKEIRKEKDVSIRQKGLRDQRGASIKETSLRKQQFQNDLSAQRAQNKARVDELAMKSLDTEGKIRARGQVGRSARKSIVANLAGYKALEADIAKAMYTSEVAGQINIELLSAKLKASGDQLQLQDDLLMEDLYNTRVDTEFGKEQLFTQLQSTNLEYDHQQEIQKLDKFNADLRAREMVASKPILAPQLMKPLEIPQAKLQKPRYPREGPRPIKFAASTGHGIAGLASGMSALSTAIAGLGD